MSGNPSGDFGPVAALRAVQCVCADRGMTPAQRLVIVRVILYANNETGLAWAAYRTIRKETGLSTGTISEALRYANGRYLTRHAVGCNGALQYRIAFQPVKRASKDKAQALQSVPSGASASAAILTPSTNPRTSPWKARRKATPPNPQVKQFIAWFCEAYQDMLGRAYVVVGGKDGATVKRLLKSLSLDELKTAAKKMLADPWGKERASIGLLASQINTWRGGTRQVGRKSTFTPATTGGADYDSLTQRF